MHYEGKLMLTLSTLLRLVYIPVKFAEWAAPMVPVVKMDDFIASMMNTSHTESGSLLCRI